MEFLKLNRVALDFLKQKEKRRKKENDKGLEKEKNDYSEKKNEGVFFSREYKESVLHLFLIKNCGVLSFNKPRRRCGFYIKKIQKKGKTKMGKAKSLQKVIQDELDKMLRIGVSKHDDKAAGINTHEFIYAWDSYNTYLKQACYFAKWVKEQPVDPAIGHKPRTLEEARPYVEKWLQKNIDDGLSAYTIKLQAASLAKIYHCKITDFAIQTPARSRANIQRSRGEKVRDKNFNENIHQDIVTFCCCTGLRRAELAQLRGTDLAQDKNGHYFLSIVRATKGGRPRISPIMGTKEEIEKVVQMMNAAGKEKVFKGISSHADIHGYRSQYATRVYEANKRPLEAFKNERLIIYKNHVIASYTSKNCHVVDRETYKEYYSPTKKEKRGKYPAMLPGYRDVSSMYHCKKDLAGTVYDRMALFAASNALGHNRESVVAEHYINA